MWDLLLGLANQSKRPTTWNYQTNNLRPFLPSLSGAILLIYFGWGKYWNDERKYLGMDASFTKDEDMDVKELAEMPRTSSGLHFPSLHESAGKKGEDMLDFDAISTNVQTHLRLAAK